MGDGVKKLGRDRAIKLAKVKLSGNFIFNIYGSLFKKKVFIDSNLKLVFPNKTSEELGKIKTKYYANRLLTSLESVTMDGSDLRRTSFKGLKYIKKANLNGYGIMFVSGHFNNWEIARCNIEHLGYPVQAIYRDLSDVACNDFRNVNKVNRTVKTMFSAKDIKPFMEGLKKGSNAIIFPDLKVKTGRNACQLDFMGNKAWTSVFTTDMAITHDMVIIPTVIYRTGNNQFEQHFFEPLFTPENMEIECNKMEHDQQVKTITQKINDFLTQELLKDPSCWYLWNTNRWGS